MVENALVVTVDEEGEKKEAVNMVEFGRARMKIEGRAYEESSFARRADIESKEWLKRFC